MITWLKNLSIGAGVGFVLGAALLHQSSTAGLYPNSQFTPGVVVTADFKELTADYNGLTYSKSHRKTTSAMKAEVCKEYSCTGKVEIDHLIPLALGGEDTVQNLWAEPEHVYVNGVDYGFHTKDKLEDYLVLQMKAGKISPHDAQQCLKDWVQCYKKYLTEPNDPDQ